MAKNLESFASQSSSFFSAGLLRVIYQDEHICVCNVANQCYVAFDYNEINGIQYGYMGGKEMAKMVIESPESLYEYILALGENNISNFLLHFNDKSFQVVSGIKLNNDINGPSKSIDYEFEREMMKLSNNRGRNK